jgi:hypothetical protein
VQFLIPERWVAELEVRFWPVFRKNAAQGLIPLLTAIVASAIFFRSFLLPALGIYVVGVSFGFKTAGHLDRFQYFLGHLGGVQPGRRDPGHRGQQRQHLPLESLMYHLARDVLRACMLAAA